MNTTPLILPLILSVLAHADAAGALRFEQTTIALRGDGTEHSFPATFRFVNDGEAPVRILAVRPACGCTTTELARDAYAPGETGELKAVLQTPDGASGMLAKDIVVETDEPENNRHTLTLRAEIREPVSVSPRLLYWLVGQPVNEKSLTATLAGPPSVRLVEAKASGPEFRVTVKETKEPAGLRVAVAPSATTQEAQGELLLVFETEGGNRIERKVALRIFHRPPGVAPLLRPLSPP